MKLKRSALGKIAVLGAVAGVLGALYAGGFFELLQQPERVRAILEGLGPWAPVLFVAAFSLLEPFFIPGIAFMIPGSLIFSLPVTSRPLGIGWVRARLPLSEKR